jgi:hypothetical protein
MAVRVEDPSGLSYEDIADTMRCEMEAMACSAGVRMIGKHDGVALIPIWTW